MRRKSCSVAPGILDAARCSQFISFICATLVIALFGAPSSQAQTFGPSYSLTSLTNSGGSILVGDKLFSHFFVIGDPYASNITVTALISGNNYGLQFGGGFVAINNDMDFQLGYMVDVTNSDNLISGAGLTFNGVVVGTGNGLAEVTEQVITNMDIGAPYGQMTVYATQSSSVLATNIPIDPPQSYLNLEKDILVDTFTITAASSISTINQYYTQVPEPSTIFLVGVGLLSGLMLRRRRH
ncbi:MAG TPA: PEP-CTERM sorting domain-containing protein [Verrucomicrobiae bacterium]|nr:PEP-CTERM sorting domain-containing protein [Verrucomicrobiae bacterium]